MSFWKTLSEKLGFMSGESDERDEDELEDGEIQEEDYDEEEEDETPTFRFPLNNPFTKNKKQTAASSSRRKAARRAAEEDDDEDEYDEEEEPRPFRSSGRRGNVIHDSRMDPRAAQEAQYTHCERIVNVRQIEECREIIKYLLKGESVLLNLENIDPKDCGRVVDLLSGAAFALQGRMLKVAHLSYLLAPENVEVIEEDVYAASRSMRYR